MLAGPNAPAPPGATSATAPPGATSTAAEPSSSASGDGRRARRERNRAAVVEALLDLYRAGELQPSTDQIAACAGISARSLFRYFDDVDDLCRVAIEHQIGRVGDHLHLDVEPTQSLAERATAVVGQRLALYEAMSWVGVVARAREGYQPLIAAELTRVRALLRAPLRAAFAPELDGLEDLDGAVARRVAAIDVTCSFEAYRLLIGDRELDPAEAQRVLTESVLRQLAPGGDLPPARAGAGR